jgi:tight adherence protein B
MVAALLVPLGPVAAAVAGGLTVLGRAALRARRVAAARTQEQASAAEALVVLVGELRAGRAPVDALRRAAAVAVGPVGEALAGGATAGAFGASVPDALVAPAERSVVPETLRGLAACWGVCQGTGSSLASAVEQLEEGLVQERRTQQEVDAELAGPRSTALLLTVLPVVGLLMGAGMGAHPVDVLLHTTLGNGCLVAGVLLDLAGIWWTGRILAAATGRHA